MDPGSGELREFEAELPTDLEEYLLQNP